MSCQSTRHGPPFAAQPSIKVISMSRCLRIIPRRMISEGLFARKLAQAACSCQALRTTARGTPDIPQEWTPPRDPGGPIAPPEFTPPSDPGTMIRPLPEYTPPEQSPNEETRRGDPPLRPIRPEEEPQVPEPESPNADPIRTPERRKEITEPPAREEPEFVPERE